jgi:hypothetical protein
MVVISVIIISGCCKKQDTNCKIGSYSIQPFVQKIDAFQCNNGNNEYTYIVNSKAQIDSLAPTCFVTSSIAVPLDEMNMKYIVAGRLSYHHNDTFQTTLLKDTCLKTLTYEVDMIQRDTTHFCCPFGSGGVVSIFCSVQNIPADYKVEVKYKYVPL